MWIILNFDIITKKLLHFSCIQFIYTICKFETDMAIEQTLYAIFCTAIAAWSIISYKMLETASLVKFSVYLLIPTMIMIELMQGTRYYVIYLFYSDTHVQLSTGNTWVEQRSSAFLLICSFVYFISSVLTAKKIEMRNSLVTRIVSYANLLDEKLPKKNAFKICSTYIYLRFFMYFDYIMLIMAILTSMVDVNLLNFSLFFYCVTTMTLQQVKAKNAWVYYVFFIDLCILTKVAICSMPRLGILNNIEITSVLGLYTMPVWKDGNYLIMQLGA